MIDTLRSLLLKDFWLKLVSLALAILVYALVSARNQPEVPTDELMDNFKTVEVPVRLVSASGEVGRHRCKPAKVAVRVQGTRETIKELNVADIRAMADLTYWDPQRGEEQVVLVTTPAGTALMQVTPSTVQIVPPEQQP